MSAQLLTAAIEAKWAMTKPSLEAVIEIIQNHSFIAPTGTFHSKHIDEGGMQAVIGTVGDRIAGTRFSTISGNVGILHVDGPIIPRSIETASSGPSASLQAFATELQMMDEDPRVQNIVLSFDSPGGMVTGVDEFSKMVANLNTPTTGFVYGYAASAAYWIASATDSLYGSATAEVGSIGTVAIFEDRTEQMEKEGVKRFEIVSNLSPNKRLSPDSDEGKVETIRILDEITELFVESVATGRGVTREDVLSDFGQGSMFLGADAVKRGMLDGITTLSELVEDLNTTNNQSQTGGVMTAKKSDTSSDSVMSAEEFKAHNPQGYEAIFSAGISAEQDRLKDIEALVEKDTSVASFVNGKKFEAGMNKANMALAIFEAKDEILKNAAAEVTNSGTQLARALEDVPSASTNVKETKTTSSEELSEEELAAAIDGANNENKANHSVGIK